jgi:hypothetical protein
MWAFDGYFKEGLYLDYSLFLKSILLELKIVSGAAVSLPLVLTENVETFLDRCQSVDRELPRYVEKELREYLSCGVLGYEFVRLKCDDCGKERAVAFSCKGRGFCPSCTGRRMSDTAARLVDDVFPDDVPIRQWVLS